MKNIKFKIAAVLSTFLLLLILCACSSDSGKKNNVDRENNPETEINFMSPLSTCIYGKYASDIQGNLELIPGDFIAWEGNGSMSWEVDIPDEDLYEFYIIANVGEEGDGIKILVRTEKEEFPFSLVQTSGPFPGGENFQVQEVKNFQRLKLSGLVRLEAGKQKITLSTSGIKKEGVLFDFRSAEFLPVSKKADIAKEEARAKASRASVDWLVQTGYGLMFHWTSQSVQPDGSNKKFEDAVNDFDVDKFADMVEETGAGYVLFTIGHAEKYCPAPLKSWERIHPGQTTQRDLIEEIANALHKKDVRLLCYLAGPGTFKFPKQSMLTNDGKQAFVDNYTDILTEMGNRYQDKIMGYWFDSWYRIFEGWPDVPFEDFFKVSKTGNKDRIICLNPWIYPDVSPWQDYWSGEVQDPIGLPENGYMKNGSSPHLPYHTLLTMEKHLWVQREAEISDPKFTPEQLSTYIKGCMDNGGFVSINLAIYQDGTVGEKALQVMKEVKKTIRK